MNAATPPDPNHKPARRRSPDAAARSRILAPPPQPPAPTACDVQPTSSRRPPDDQVLTATQPTIPPVTATTLYGTREIVRVVIGEARADLLSRPQTVTRIAADLRAHRAGHLAEHVHLPPLPVDVDAELAAELLAHHEAAEGQVNGILDAVRYDLEQARQLYRDRMTLAGGDPVLTAAAREGLAKARASALSLGAKVMPDAPPPVKSPEEAAEWARGVYGTGR